MRNGEITISNRFDKDGFMSWLKEEFPRVIDTHWNNDFKWRKEKMTLRELIESGIVIEGYRKIQCWENEDNPTIYYEGNNCGNLEEYLDREIAYIFPYSPTPNEAAICIELAEI